MINIKEGICIDCGPGSKPKKLIAKRCETHYWQFRAEENKKKSSKKVNTTKPNQASKKNVCLPLATPFALKQWYIYHVNSCIWVCENCQNPIIPLSEWHQFSAQAHILPKEHFPSVKLVLDNHLVLGHTDCSCHKKWDNTWEDAFSMPVFATAKQRVGKFIHLLSDEELKRLPSIFTDPQLKTL